MKFGILGPLLIQAEGRDVRLGGPRQAKILAALLLDANLVVPLPRLVAVMWDDGGPATAVRQVQDAVSGLRRRLGLADAGRGIITTHGQGYRINVPGDAFDLLVFEDHVARAQRSSASGEHPDAASSLRSALRCWRGPAFADLTGDALTDSAALLAERRLSAQRQLMSVELVLHRHHEIVADLAALVLEHPLDESFARLYMLALHRCGRRADALAAFHTLRSHLVDELGIEPGNEVHGLFQQILRDDDELTVASESVDRRAAQAGRSRSERPAPSTGPMQLPADTRLFTGRSAELEQLLALGRQAAAEREGYGAVLVSVIDGMPGLGKTALAVHAAHRLGDQFPDGRLFIDLHGHTPGASPLTAAEALGALLRSLGVSQDLIPADVDERASLYRTRLAGSRVLIVLDNAAGTAQIRPLIPGHQGCLVLVTARNRLSGLDEAHPLALDALPEPEAVALFREVAGPGRIDAADPADPADPACRAIAEIVGLCGHIPLAIRITAARLRHRRTLTLDSVLTQLRDEHARLGYLADDDRSITAAFETSYGSLASAEQHAFRLLGSIPGPDFDVHATARLLDTAHRDAERVLEALLDHNLLIQHTEGRYRFHDMVRLYARSLAGDEPAEGRAALDRLLAYYQHTVTAADRHLAEFTRPAPLPTSAVNAANATPVAALGFSNSADALAWMRAERANLLAAVRYAAGHEPSARAVALSSGLASFLIDDGPLDLAVELQQAAAGLAEAGGDPVAWANALIDLGRSRRLHGKEQNGVAQFEQALSIFRELGNGLGEAESLHELATTRYMANDFPSSRELAQQALELFRRQSDRLGEANAIVLLGRIGFMTEGYRAALERFENALRIYQELGHRHGEAAVLNRIADVHIVEGPATAALEPLGQALTLHRELGQLRSEANLLWQLGRMWVKEGDYAKAAEPTRLALDLYRRLGNRRSEALAMHLSGYISFSLEDYPRATEAFEQAGAIMAEIGSKGGAAMTSEFLGRVAAATGDPRRGIALLREAEAVYRELDSVRKVAYTLGLQVPMFIELGDHATAEQLLLECLRIFRQVNSPAGEASTLNSLGELQVRTGRAAEASASYRQALEKAREGADPDEEKRALSGIEHDSSRPGAEP